MQSGKSDRFSRKRHFECLCRFVIVSLPKFMNSHHWLMRCRSSFSSRFPFCCHFFVGLINGSCHFPKINTLFHDSTSAKSIWILISYATKQLSDENGSWKLKLWINWSRLKICSTNLFVFELIGSEMESQLKLTCDLCYSIVSPHSHGMFTWLFTLKLQLNWVNNNYLLDAQKSHFRFSFLTRASLKTCLQIGRGGGREKNVMKAIVLCK